MIQAEKLLHSLVGFECSHSIRGIVVNNLLGNASGKLQFLNHLVYSQSDVPSCVASWKMSLKRNKADPFIVNVSEQKESLALDVQQSVE